MKKSQENVKVNARVNTSIVPFHALIRIASLIVDERSLLVLTVRITFFIINEQLIISLF